MKNATVSLFPYSRRADVLADVAKTYVANGYDAGNERMHLCHGERMIAEMEAAGASEDEIIRAIDQFCAACNRAALAAMLQAGKVWPRPVSSALEHGLERMMPTWNNSIFYVSPGANALAGNWS